MRISSDKLLVLFLTLLCTSFVHRSLAQGERDHWMFGNNHWIHFQSGTPIYEGYSAIVAGENCASISTSSGDLQFYATSYNIWNREHQEMPLGDTIGDGGSTWTQGVLILPVPGDTEERFYYILNLGKSFGVAGKPLKYSLVDMQLDGGRGDLVLDEIGKVLIPDFFMEQLQAVRHANGEDWWLIARVGDHAPTVDDGAENNTFNVFHVSAEGVSSPLVQSIGLLQTQYGELTASPNGAQLALAIYDTDSVPQSVQLFDFDRCEGTISNPQTLMSETDSLEGEVLGKRFYGCTFSPDGSKLYVSTIDWKEAIFQIDLESDSPQVNTIFKKQIPDHFGGQIELGPDGKIYYAIKMSPVAPPDSTLPGHWLGIVNNPNLPGAACDYDTFGIALGGNQMWDYGLPNHVNYTLGALPGGCDTTTTSATEVDFPKSPSIYPTISQGQFNIVVPDGMGTLNVLITNIQGITFWNQDIAVSAAIDLSQEKNGIYFVKVTSTRGHVLLQQKIVKVQ
jgi:hypothetical protein